MIFDQGEENLNAWKTQMRSYEKGKRTKLPFGKSIPQINHVTYEQVKMKESMFNPVLQSYQKLEDEVIADYRLQEKRAKSLLTHFKNTAKYEKNYDIVNLHSNQSQSAVEGPNKKLGPIRNAYNVINNQKLPDFYFKNRDLRLPQERQKKLIPTHQKQFNIVTNIYKQDHEDRASAEQQKQRSTVMDKYWKTHNYDAVYGKFYNQIQELKYQEQLKKEQEEHGKDAEKKLPPSYVHRQPFISDYSKPLPETLRALDEKYAAAKKRFQLKYIVQDEYEKRNLEEDIKQDQILKNHVHFGRVLDEKAKQFDIITNKPYQQNRAEDLYHKKIQIASWDQLIKETQQEQQKLSATKHSKFIKSGGFNA